MNWIFPAFFGVLALVLLVYIMMSVRERMHPREQVVCVLESRQREKFPKLTLFGRRDRVDYVQIYRTDEGKRITVCVTRAVYKSIPKEVEGVLTHQGTLFYSFAFDGQTVTRKCKEPQRK